MYFDEEIRYSENDDRFLNIQSRKEDRSYWYCLEDVYDYAIETIEKNEFNFLCVAERDIETWDQKIKMIDKSIMYTINEVIDTSKPFYDGPNSKMSPREIVSVIATDEKAMFKKPLFSVERLEDGGYFIWTENLFEDISGYIASSDYADVFEPIFPEDKLKYKSLIY